MTSPPFFTSSFVKRRDPRVIFFSTFSPFHDSGAHEGAAL